MTRIIKWFGGVAGGRALILISRQYLIRWILAIPLLISTLKGVNIFGWNNDIFPEPHFQRTYRYFYFHLYIVLWIVLPSAYPYQKMEMRGKSVDVKQHQGKCRTQWAILIQRIQNCAGSKRCGGKTGTVPMNLQRSRQAVHLYSATGNRVLAMYLP